MSDPAMPLASSAAPTAPEATARSFRNEYGVTLRRIPLGRVSLTGSVGASRYALEFATRLPGVVRALTNRNDTARAEGAVTATGLAPLHFERTSTVDERSERIVLAFADGALAKVDIEPPRRGGIRRVPITAAHLAGAVDPLTAFFWTTPGGLSPEACARRIPVFDGTNRFDLAVSYIRQERYGLRRQPGGEALVCAAEYVPVAGHLPDRPSPLFEAGSPIELWMAPLGDTGLAAPVRLVAQTQYGGLAVTARQFAAA